jgi:hypothetical protein
VSAGEAQFVFGYGSLVAEHERGHVATLRGHRRHWGVAMDNARDLPGYKYYRLKADGSRPPIFVAFLDIAPDRGANVAGICMPVAGDDLAELDDRERNYDRVDVTDLVDEPRGRVWAYRGSAAGQARLHEGLTRGRAAVSHDYLNGVLAALAVFAPGEADAMARSPSDAGLDVLDLERIEIPRDQRTPNPSPLDNRPMSFDSPM